MAELKKNIISLRLNDKEAKTLRNNAEMCGMSVSDYVRIKCLYTDCVRFITSKDGKIKPNRTAMEG